MYKLMTFLLQLWDARKKGCQQTFQSTYQVTAVSFNDTAEQVISGGIDNDIKVSNSFKFTVLMYIYFSYLLTLFLTEINSYLLPVYFFVSNLILKVRTSCNYKETVGSNVLKKFRMFR